jgi:hypothetical protein
MAEPPVPTVLAMLLCDQVIIDEPTKKKSLIGIFDNINAFQFPVALNVAIYVKLTDGEGEYRFRFRVVKLKGEAVMANLDIKGKIQSRLEPSEIAANLVGFIVPEPGKYEIQFFANDAYLGRITMQASVMQTPDAFPNAGGSPWQRKQ